MKQPRGKVPTKGGKQILTENTATVYFYRNMALSAGLFYNLINIGLFFESITYASIFMNLFVTAIYVACYQLMCYMSRPSYSETSQVVDPGVDLNMEGGLGEHIKDIVILASVTHIMAVFSNYFWFLLLVLPFRALYLLWVHVLGPWFFQPDPRELSDLEEKKRRKMERKMRRQ